jgi:kinesin family protein 11
MVDLKRSTMASSVRSGVAGRGSLRQPSRASSTARHHYQQQTSAATSRIDRTTGAASPAESLSSVATSGTKRKERDFESDAGIGEEETNINVVVRCRGRNEREVRENSAVVVRADGVKGKLVELSMGPNALSNKTYNFDRVFSPAADQAMIFDDVVKPILDEVGGKQLPPYCSCLCSGWTRPILGCPHADTESKPRCSPGTTAPSSPTARPARARRIPCPAT